MWRFLLKLTVFLSVFVGVGNYLVYLKTGRLPLSELWHRYSKIPTSLPTPSLPSFELPQLPNMGQADASKHNAYKWTDDSGIVHYSDQAPQGAQAKLIHMDPNRNVLQSSAAPEVKEETKQKPVAAENPGTAADPTQTPSYSEAIEKAKAAVELIKASAPKE